MLIDLEIENIYKGRILIRLTNGIVSAFDGACSLVKVPRPQFYRDIVWHASGSWLRQGTW